MHETSRHCPATRHDFQLFHFCFAQFDPHKIPHSIPPSIKCGERENRSNYFTGATLAAAGWVDWLAAGIFTLYIGYDCHRAMAIPATGRNSVDVAISLYLDIYNLFLTILRLLSRRD